VSEKCALSACGGRLAWKGNERSGIRVRAGRRIQSDPHITHTIVVADWESTCGLGTSSILIMRRQARLERKRGGVGLGLGLTGG